MDNSKIDKLYNASDMAVDIIEKYMNLASSEIKNLTSGEVTASAIDTMNMCFAGLATKKLFEKCPEKYKYDILRLYEDTMNLFINNVGLTIKVNEVNVQKNH